MASLMRDIAKFNAVEKPIGPLDVTDPAGSIDPSGALARSDGVSRPGQRTAPATVINSASQQSNSKQLAKIGPTTALLSQLALAFLDVATHGARIRQGYRRSRG